jgi:hypothetical protein
MDYVAEQPPKRLKPGGKPTRYQAAIDNAKKHPGKWFRLKGEHHSSNIITLKGHGMSVRSKRGEEKHKHFLWICYQPEPEAQAS